VIFDSASGGGAVSGGSGSGSGSGSDGMSTVVPNSSGIKKLCDGREKKGNGYVERK